MSEAIEAALHDFAEADTYTNKLRSLAASLKSNAFLCKDLCIGAISSSQLVRMSPKCAEILATQRKLESLSLEQQELEKLYTSTNATTGGQQ